MRKSKVYAQGVKRIMRPEVSHCLECQRRLQRCVTISQRTVVTLSQVINLVHCGYRCPAAACPGRKQLYRSAEADALALPGCTFGLDIVILVGQLRLREHKTVDEIHRLLTERLAPLGQTISRREILFLFEAYTARFPRRNRGEPGCSMERRGAREQGLVTFHRWYSAGQGQ